MLPGLAGIIFMNTPPFPIVYIEEKVNNCEILRTNLNPVAYLNF